MAPAVSHPSSANRGANSPAPKSANFQIPGRKNAGVAIKDPNSGAVKTFDKPLASPAPPSKSPAIISGTPTPPPGTPSHESQHARGESKAVKTDEEKKNDMKDAIARKIEADKEEERRKKAEEEAKLKEAAQAEEAAKAEAAKAEAARAEAAKAEGERAATAAAAAAAAREAETEIASKLSAEEEAERLRREEDEMFAEMERQEQEAEERYQKKRAAEKAERERQAVEAAAREEEDLKQQERAAEAAEEARLKKLEETEGDDKRERVSLFEALKDKQPAATPLAPSAAIDTPAASGAATPVSDSSAMGPPPARTIGGGKSKPAALKLETSKTVEAPQPSAALMSLRSARFLTIIDDATYPPSIASPNPALNANAPMGRFRYDINFLTQFQPVFVEKPSETWTQKVKETVGDTSETPASARGARPSGTMSSRASSQRGNVFSGAPFGVLPVFGGGPRPIPAGTTSAQRFEASTKGPIRYNANAPGGFPMGFAPQMARTASSSSMGHPQSPRNSTSHRGTGGRGSKGGKPQRENDKDAKTMPLTAGMDLKPIEISATGWKPRSVGANAAGMAGPPPGGDGYLAPDVVQRKVKAALNKMTPSTFDKISTQILDIVAQSKKETDGRTLRQVIQLTFEKATDEAHWAQMYAEFCSRMLAHMTPEIRDESMPLDKAGNVTAGGTLFRKYLLNRCQQDFEAGWKAKLPEKPEGESQEAAMLSDAYYVAAAAKRRGLGLVRFIGELFKLSMLTPRIMHMCVRRLVDFDGMPDEAEVESLTGLLKTIGENLDGEEKSRQLMDAYFDRIKAMEAVEGLPSRLKFMLMVSPLVPIYSMSELASDRLLPGHHRSSKKGLEIQRHGHKRPGYARRDQTAG
jgi:translation initiation factor 4G